MTSAGQDGVPARGTLSKLEEKAALIMQAVAADLEKGGEYVVKTINAVEADFSAWKAANPILAALAADAVVVITARLQASGVPVTIIEGLAGEILAEVASLTKQAAVKTANS